MQTQALAATYQLPFFYRHTLNPTYHGFIFIGSTDAEVRTLAKDAAKHKGVSKVEVKCELGVTKEDVARYCKIFKEVLHPDTGIDIHFKTGFDRHSMLCEFYAFRRETVMKRAVLN